MTTATTKHGMVFKKNKTEVIQPAFKNSCFANPLNRLIL